jgi:hypothetical protein
MIALLLLMLADPITFTPGQPVRFAWDHVETNLTFRMLTNSALIYDFPPSTVKITPGPTNSFEAGFPGFPTTGAFDLTVRALDAEGNESDDSNALAIRVVEKAELAPAPKLTIEKVEPFRASFQGATNAIYRVEGRPDLSLPWKKLGQATEDPPASGRFYFLDIEKRPSFLYRVVSP